MDENPAEQSAPLHPIALEVLDAIVVDEDGAKSQLPASALAAFRKTVKLAREQRTVCEHLCVVAVFLNHRGLLAAGAQLIELAAIGLSQRDLETKLASPDTMKRASQALTGPPAGKRGAVAEKGGAGFGAAASLRPKSKH